MQTETKELTSEMVESALKAQGRKKNWLAEQLGIDPQTITNKLRRDKWSVSETIVIRELLNIE